LDFPGVKKLLSMRGNSGGGSWRALSEAKEKSAIRISLKDG